MLDIILIFTSIDKNRQTALAFRKFSNTVFDFIFYIRY